MPKLRFLPTDFQVATSTDGQSQIDVEVDANTKLLVAANRHRVPIRFGCASCRCGTCGVKIAVRPGGELSPMKDNERELLQRMLLPVDGSVRLACQARILAGEVEVDLAFQDTYSPDDGDHTDDDDDSGDDDGDGA